MGAPADAVAAAPRHVKDDLRELPRAFPTDDDFAKALRAIARRLPLLARHEAASPDHDLGGWHRIRFSSGVTSAADLRIIFRRTKAGVELRAFGHRHDPESVYRWASEG